MNDRCRVSEATRCTAEDTEENRAPVGPPRTNFLKKVCNAQHASVHSHIVCTGHLHTRKNGFKLKEW